MSDQFESIEPADLAAGGGVSVDLQDEGESLVVVADLAGYESDDIEVTLPDARTVRISAERDLEREESVKGRTLRQERHESVSRTLSLPEDVDESETSATYENGVLTVTLPKRAADADSHSIPVN